MCRRESTLDFASPVRGRAHFVAAGITLQSRRSCARISRGARVNAHQRERDACERQFRRIDSVSPAGGLWL